MSEIKDFSKSSSKEPLRFKIDDDIFEASPAIGAELFREIASGSAQDAAGLSAISGVKPGEYSPDQMKLAATALDSQSSRAVAFLDAVLLPDSAARFAERLRSSVDPISLGQMYEVWGWLIEQYSGRPTQPSQSTSSGSDGTGTSSTAGALVEA